MLPPTVAQRVSHTAQSFEKTLSGSFRAAVQAPSLSIIACSATIKVTKPLSVQNGSAAQYALNRGYPSFEVEEALVQLQGMWGRERPRGSSCCLPSAVRI